MPKDLPAVKKVEINESNWASWSPLYVFPQLEELDNVWPDEYYHFDWVGLLRHCPNLHTVHTVFEQWDVIFALKSMKRRLRNLTLRNAGLDGPGWTENLELLGGCECLEGLALGFTFSDMAQCFTEETMTAFARGVQENGTSTKLSVQATVPWGEAVTGVAHILLDHLTPEETTFKSRLQTLVLDIYAYSQGLLSAMYYFICKNKSVEHLVLKYESAEGEGDNENTFDSMCCGFDVNETITTLDVTDCYLSHSNFDRLGRAVRDSAHLYKLLIDVSGHSGASLQPFFCQISERQSFLRLGGRFPLADPAVAECILEAVETSPFILSIDGLDSGPGNRSAYLLHTKIDYYLRLNQGGRQLVKAYPAPPLGFWSMVLASGSGHPDVLYHLLRSKPDLVAPTTHSLKRNATVMSDLSESAGEA